MYLVTIASSPTYITYEHCLQGSLWKRGDPYLQARCQCCPRDREADTLKGFRPSFPGAETSRIEFPGASVAVLQPVDKMGSGAVCCLAGFPHIRCLQGPHRWGLGPAQLLSCHIHPDEGCT